MPAFRKERALANLTQNKWSVISAVATVAALLLPVLLYIVGHQSKNLSVATVSRAVLVNLSQAEGGSLTLTYNGTPVSHLTAATIEVRNDGTRPIEQSDFERPLLIRFPKDSSILASTLGERVPEELQPVIKLEAGVITVAPLLLNPGDRFRITAQLLGDFGEPTVEARLSGIPAITRQAFRDPFSRSPWLPRIIVVLSMSSYFYFASFTLLALFAKSRFFALPLADGIVVAFLLAGSSGLSVDLAFGASSFWSIPDTKVLVLLILISIPCTLLAQTRRRAALAAWSSAPPSQ